MPICLIFKSFYNEIATDKYVLGKNVHAGMHVGLGGGGGGGCMYVCVLEA